MTAPWLALHVTERCQRACLHCVRTPSSPPVELTPEAAARILDQAIALHRVEHVGLTGGEPLLHPRIAELLDAIVARRLRYHLVTNGARIDALVALLDALPARREALASVDLSLDGADEATQDAVRGEGSWREAMNAALALRARSIPFSLQLTLHRRNVAQLEPVGLLAAQLGARALSVLPMIATGRPSDTELGLGLDAILEARDRVDRLAATLQLPVLPSESFPRTQPFHVCEPWRSVVLHVDPRGRLTLCCQLAGRGPGDEDVVADLATVSLAEAHTRLLERVHRLQAERLALAHSERLDGWDLASCDWCARRHGKPGWGGAGAAT